MEDKLKILNEKRTWADKYLPESLVAWAMSLIVFMVLLLVGSCFVALSKVLWSYILS